ncbi:MAG: WYL domain-containing protein [Candidatus Sericytochromatia bacterium]|nr:WYL domain-containing protein [Candidatus Sericytochromatia bacterium]
MSNRLERLMYIDRLIRAPGGTTTDRLIEVCEVSRRSIEDDLRFMRDRMRAPLIYDRSANRYRYTNPDFRLPALDLDDDDLMALLVGAEIIARTGGSAVAAPYRAALSKITDRAVEPSEPGIRQELVGIWIGGNQGPPAPAGLFRDLNAAILDRAIVHLTYRAASTDAITERPVEPYGLYLHGDTWYLIAFCRLRQDWRYFHLARIQTWQVQAERYDWQPDFDISVFLHRTFSLEQTSETFEAVIRFLPPSSRYVRERLWHPQQTLTVAPDGSVTLTLPGSGQGELVRWVLGYGPDAEVLAPDSLRSAVQDHLHEAMARYR